MSVTFTDRDAEFEEWRDRHPNAFVVNHDRVPRASYVVLHRADCVRLRSGQGSNWTSTYSKTCGETLEDIATWARSRVGSVDLHRCSSCAPPDPSGV